MYIYVYESRWYLSTSLIFTIYSLRYASRLRHPMQRNEFTIARCQWLVVRDRRMVTSVTKVKRRHM